MNPIGSQEYTINELNFHLDMMQETLKKNPNIKASYFDGFIEFFNNEIVKFNKKLPNEKKIIILDNQLSHLDQTIKTVSDNIKKTNPFEDVVVQRMGTEITTQEIASNYSEGFVKAGLEKLNDTHKVIPIKGDGHCFFRSILGHLLVQISSLTTDEYNEFLTRQSTFIGNKIHLKSGYDLLKARLDEIRDLPQEEKSKKIYEVMLDPKVSDNLVHYLRKLCVEHHSRNDSEVLMSEFIESHGSANKYLQTLGNMKNELILGGEPEILALTEILGVKIHILDCNVIGQGEDVNASNSVFGSEHAKLTFPLLFRPGHYDMAIAK